MLTTCDLAVIPIDRFWRIETILKTEGNECFRDGGGTAD